MLRAFHWLRASFTNTAKFFQVFAVETRNGQTDNLITGIGHTLHFHAAFCTYEQDFRIRTQFLNRVGNGYGRENVSARAATADDNARFVVLCFHI